MLPHHGNRDLADVTQVRLWTMRWRNYPRFIIQVDPTWSYSKKKHCNYKDEITEQKVRDMKKMRGPHPTIAGFEDGERRAPPKEHGWLLEARIIPLLTAGRSQGPQYYHSKELNSANTLNAQKARFFPRPWRKEHRPVDTLILAHSDPGWSSDYRTLRQYNWCFEPLCSTLL